MPISATDLNKAYLAYFGRPADLTGKTYFATLEQADVIKAFDASAESKALYGNDAAAKVNAIYQNLFNRDAEPEGLVYWTTLINQGRVTPSGAAFAILNGALGTDATAVQNKLAASEAFVAAMDTTSELVGYSGMDAAASARNWLKAVGADAATLTTAVAGAQAAVTAAVAAGTGEGGAGFQLTNGTDVASANVFTAGLVYTPGGDDRINSLQDEDRLTGTGTNATLNATLGNAQDNGGTMITPTLVNINTVNAAFTGSSAGARVNTLDLQDATGVDAVNITRISEGFGATVQNIASAAKNLSVKNSQSPNNFASFTFLGSAVNGTANETTLTVSNVNTGGIRVEQNGAATEGFETINLVSSGSANAVGVLQAEDLATLTISGTQDLRLGGRGVTTGAQGVEAVRYADGLANVNGSLTNINASTFEGKLDLTLGNESGQNLDNTSGVAVQLTVTGGKADDTIRLVGATIGGTATNTDRINGGEGNNTLVVTGGTTIAAAGTAAAPVANVTNIQALEVRAGHLNGSVPDVVNINADAFDKLATIYVRNEGQSLFNDNGAGGGIANNGIQDGAEAGFGAWTSVGEGMTVNLTNLTSAQANAITLAHGTTGNSTIANNVLNIGLKVATGAADTAQVTIVDGVNNNPVFNANIGAVAVERVTLVDSDTESNTVHLNQGVRALPGAVVAVGQYAQTGSSITLQGGAAGQFISLDSFAAVAAPAGGNAGYGYATDGTAGSSTTVAAAVGAIAGVPVAVSTSVRDNAVATVFNGTLGTAVDGATRHMVENINAGDYLGDVVVRVGDVTRTDGFSSMNIKTGAGNDTIIFDTINSTSAGFTSGDTVAGGAGNDTLVIDGNSATLPGAPRISVQTSEWDNLTGIDTLRLGTNAAGYFVRIDNDFVSQTDAGNRLTIINNDGRLDTNFESNAVVDLTALSREKLVTFVGANGTGAAISVNRIIVGDTSANAGQILDGGDTDVRVSTTGGYVAGNNNVYEVRNTSDVSINDLAQTKNFSRIEFVNDQATVQTLTLALNATVADALADASHVATAADQEALAVVAGGVAGSLAGAALNVDGSLMGNAFRVNLTSDQTLGVADSVTLNDNLGGAGGHTVDISDTAGNDVLTFSGAIGNQWAAAQTVTVSGTVNSANLVVQNASGLALVTHNVSWDNGDVIRLADTNNLLKNLMTTPGVALTMNGGIGNDVITGGAGNDVITGGAGNDVITGGAGADILTGGAGADTFVFAAGASGAPSGTVFDSIEDYATGVDIIDFGATNIVQFATVTAAAAGTAGVTATGVVSFNAADNTLALRVAAVANVIAAAAAGNAVVFGAGADSYIYVTDGVAGVGANDVMIKLTGIAAAAATDTLTIVGGDITGLV